MDNICRIFQQKILTDYKLILGRLDRFLLLKYFIKRQYLCNIAIGLGF